MRYSALALTWVLWGAQLFGTPATFYSDMPTIASSGTKVLIGSAANIGNSASTQGSIGFSSGLPATISLLGYEVSSYSPGTQGSFSDGSGIGTGPYATFPNPSPAATINSCAGGNTITNTGTLPSGFGLRHARSQVCSNPGTLHCVDSTNDGSTCMTASCSLPTCYGSASAPKQAGAIVDSSGDLVESTN